jgi:hypothetical protein
MRRKQALLVVSVLMGIWVMSCVTPATDEEIESMCNNLVELRGEISNPAVETMVSDIQVRFDKETSQLEANRTREQKMLNEDLQAKLDATDNEEEKAKLKEEYASKIQEVASKHEPGIAAMTAKKQEAVEEAKKQADQNRAAWNEAVTQCTTQAKNEGVSQEVARCRIQADSTDKYWNACR